HVTRAVHRAGDRTVDVTLRDERRSEKERRVEKIARDRFCDAPSREGRECAVDHALGAHVVHRIAHLEAQRTNGDMTLGPRRIEHEDGLDQSEALRFRRRGEHALVGGFGKGDPADGRGRAPAHVLDKVHRVPRRSVNRSLKRSRSAVATAGWTRLDTSPPNRAISRTRLALMYVVSNDGTMNTVSRRGERCRFMSAI